VIDFTGPQRALEDSEPLVTGRRARQGDRVDDTPDQPAPGRRAAARRVQEADTADDDAKGLRSRRRVGWRKGSDVDEELWPVEGFGGVSDEQFWDDLAADKPLATTARAAQPDTAARRRQPNAGPLPDLYPGDDRGRGNGRGGTAEGPGTHPQPRLAADDRTAIQPAATAPAASQPSSGATRPVRAGHQPAEPRGRSRAGLGVDEDPLTSPAYSLRPRGSVDGRSYPSSRQSRDLSRERYESAVGQETQTFSLADAQAAGGYPDGVPPFRQVDRPSHSANGRGRSDASRSDPSRSDGYRSDTLRSDPLRSDPQRSDPLRSGDVYGGTVPSRTYPYPQQPYSEPTQSMGMPPYGERYEYGNPAGQKGSAVSWAQGTQGIQASPGGDPRRANGGWNTGRAGANAGGDGNWSSRPAYPPVNGYRGPYDPRGNERWLITTALT
jgi:hypothetical protein